MRAAIRANGGQFLDSYCSLILASVPPGRFHALLAGAGVLRVVPDLAPAGDVAGAPLAMWLPR